MAKRKADKKVGIEFADADWTEAVAAVAGVDSGVVADVHRVHGIEAAATSGEQVRIRIAAALAVLDVAAARGFGRHPGLLIVDSPGSQEMSQEDFTALIEAVARATRDYPDWQVILGAVWRPEIEGHVPCDQRKQVRGAAELF